MLHLFIDTNVLVRFYSFTDDSLIEAEKFLALIQSKAIELYVPEQVMNEYMQNSEAELVRSITTLNDTKIAVWLPRFIDHYDEATSLKALLKSCNDAKTILVKQVRKDAAAGKLKADKLVSQILNSGQLTLSTEVKIRAAKNRRDVGNPPGKPSSLGHQINWESLISAVPKKSDIHLISRDSDFSSKLDTSLPSHFFLGEWATEKKSKVHLYPSLGHFTKTYFPEIKIPADVVKSDAITKLIGAGSFATTNAAVAKLQTVYDEITSDEALLLLQAAIDNSQIRWILDDQAIQEFYEKLHEKFWLKVPAKMNKELEVIATYFKPIF